jgi:hypothetical protein
MRKFLLLALLTVGCGGGDKSDLDIVGGFRTYQPWYGKVGGCGSSLIAPRWLVSAAHCGNPKEVTLGLFDRQDPKNGGKPFEKIAVKRVVKHPSWDLQLIELKRASKFKPIKIHEGRDPPDGYRLQTYGFGNTAWQSGAPRFLQGTVFVFNKSATDKARRQIIRAGERGKAVCHGDSGGPLVYNVISSDSQNTKVIPSLIATTTFTVDKCRAGGLMGFTRIDIGWIKNIIK